MATGGHYIHMLLAECITWYFALWWKMLWNPSIPIQQQFPPKDIHAQASKVCHCHSPCRWTSYLKQGIQRESGMHPNVLSIIKQWLWGLLLFCTPSWLSSLHLWYSLAYFMELAMVYIKGGIINKNNWMYLHYVVSSVHVGSFKLAGYYDMSKMYVFSTLYPTCSVQILNISWNLNLSLNFTGISM